MNVTEGQCPIFTVETFTNLLHALYLSNGSISRTSLLLRTYSADAVTSSVFKLANFLKSEQQQPHNTTTAAKCAKLILSHLVPPPGMSMTTATNTTTTTTSATNAADDATNSVDNGNATASTTSTTCHNNHNNNDNNDNNNRTLVNLDTANDNTMTNTNINSSNNNNSPSESPVIPDSSPSPPSLSLNYQNNNTSYNSNNNNNNNTRSRTSVRLVPLDQSTSNAVIATGGHPYVEVVLRASKTVWDVTAHLFTKWKLPVRVSIVNNPQLPSFRTRLSNFIHSGGNNNGDGHPVIDANFTLAVPHVPQQIFAAGFASGLVKIPETTVPISTNAGGTGGVGGRKRTYAPPPTPRHSISAHGTLNNEGKNKKEIDQRKEEKCKEKSKEKQKKVKISCRKRKRSTTTTEDKTTNQSTTGCERKCSNSTSTTTTATNGKKRRVTNNNSTMKRSLDHLLPLDIAIDDDLDMCVNLNRHITPTPTPAPTVNSEKEEVHDSFVSIGESGYSGDGCGHSVVFDDSPSPNNFVTSYDNISLPPPPHLPPLPPSSLLPPPPPPPPLPPLVTGCKRAIEKDGEKATVNVINAVAVVSSEGLNVGSKGEINNVTVHVDDKSARLKFNLNVEQQDIIEENGSLNLNDVDNDALSSSSVISDPSALLFIQGLETTETAVQTTTDPTPQPTVINNEREDNSSTHVAPLVKEKTEVCNEEEERLWESCLQDTEFDDMFTGNDGFDLGDTDGNNIASDQRNLKSAAVDDNDGDEENDVEIDLSLLLDL